MGGTRSLRAQQQGQSSELWLGAQRHQQPHAEAFLLKNVDIFIPLGSSKHKLASQGQSSTRKAAGLVLTSVFGRVLPQFGGYQICCLLFTFPGLPAV